MNSSTINLTKAQSSGLSDRLFHASSYRVGMRYLFVLSFMFALGILPVIFMIVKSRMLGMDDSFAQIFSVTASSHGLIMIFFFAIPLFQVVGGNLWLPSMLEVKELNFPRMNNVSFLLFITSCILLLAGSITGLDDINWKLYNTEYYFSPGSLLIYVGISLLIVSVILSSLRIMTSVYSYRKRFESIIEIPILVKSFFISSFLLLIALPAMLFYVLLSIGEMIFGFGLLDSRMGGDMILSSQLFWISAHPILYSLFIMGAGIVSKFIFEDKTQFQSKLHWIFLALTIFGLIGWGQHMFVSGLSEKYVLFFSFLGMLPLIPVSFLLLIWIKNLIKQTDLFSPIKLFMMISLISIAIGGLTGLMMIIPSLNVQFHNSIFVSGHVHMILFGFVGSAFLAMFIYMWKNIWGIAYHRTIMKLSALSLLLGILLTEGSKLFDGLTGNSVYLYYSQAGVMIDICNSVGLLLLLQGMIMIVLNLIYHFRKH